MMRPMIPDVTDVADAAIHSTNVDANVDAGVIGQETGYFRKSP